MIIIFFFNKKIKKKNLIKKKIFFLNKKVKKKIKVRKIEGKIRLKKNNIFKILKIIDFFFFINLEFWGFFIIYKREWPIKVSQTKKIIIQKTKVF
jgi:hypothetical protein